VAGLFMARRHPGAWLTVLYALFITAISALAFGLTRYRLPVMPFLIMFSAYAFRRRRVGPGGQSPSSSSSV
jgi:hypothetical protein